MAVAVSGEVVGLETFQEAFTVLGKTLSKQVLSGAMRKVLRPIQRDAAARAWRGGSFERARPGRLSLDESIKISPRLNKRQSRGPAPSGTVRMYIVSRAPHAHLVEFGHLLVKGTKFKGNQRVIGRVQPYPFLRPAWDAGKRKMIADFAKTVGEVLVRTGKRLAKQAKTGKLSKRSRSALTRAA